MTLPAGSVSVRPAHPGASALHPLQPVTLIRRDAVDCFIAQCVLESSGILLHDDADFERIKSVRPLQTLGS